MIVAILVILILAALFGAISVSNFFWIAVIVLAFLLLFGRQRL